MLALHKLHKPFSNVVRPQKLGVWDALFANEKGVKSGRTDGPALFSGGGKAAAAILGGRDASDDFDQDRLLGTAQHYKGFRWRMHTSPDGRKVN